MGTSKETSPPCDGDPCALLSIIPVCGHGRGRAWEQSEPHRPMMEAWASHGTPRGSPITPTRIQINDFEPEERTSCFISRFRSWGNTEPTLLFRKTRRGTVMAPNTALKRKHGQAKGQEAQRTAAPSFAGKWDGLKDIVTPWM